MVKRKKDGAISIKLNNKHKVYVCSFSPAKVKSIKYYSKPRIPEDKPDHLVIHV